MCITSLLAVCQTIRGPFRPSHCAILTNFYTVAFLLLTSTSFKYINYYYFFLTAVYLYFQQLLSQRQEYTVHTGSLHICTNHLQTFAEFSLQTIDERKKRNLFVICVGFVFFLICLDFWRGTQCVVSGQRRGTCCRQTAFSANSTPMVSLRLYCFWIAVHLICLAHLAHQRAFSIFEKWNQANFRN